MKLLIFDKKSKRIVGANFVWKEEWSIPENWEGFDPVIQKRIIVAADVEPFNNQGYCIQPKNYNSETSNEYIYVDPKTLPVYS